MTRVSAPYEYSCAATTKPQEVRETNQIMLLGKLKHAVKSTLNPTWKREFQAEQRRQNEAYRFAREMREAPRYARGHSDVLGHRIEFSDALSFLSMKEEIFDHEIYRFRSTSQAPFIIDGGANIGLSALYFKKLYPDCRIVAFEPDDAICTVLKTNLETWQARDVEVVKKALWSSQTTLEFQSEGADAGRIVEGENLRQDNSPDAADRISRIETVRLRDYLDRPVDFLKLDIEGAETEVVLDCADALSNVANGFIEYHSFAGQEQTLTDLLRVLRETGLRVHIHAPTPTAQPLFERATYHGMDMQLNIFAWRD